MSAAAAQVSGAIILDLTRPYRRAIVTHALCERLSDLAEGIHASSGEEVPAVDRMAPDVGRVLRPWLDRVGSMEPIVAALRVLADDSRESLEWPLSAEDLTTLVGSAAMLLGESLTSTPDEDLEDHAGALKATRAFLREIEGGRS